MNIINKMIRRLILLLLICYIKTDIKIKKYSEPGNYVLTPEMYENATEMIVEVWGAGGGGCSFKCAIGGGSGSYIKASVMTNGETYNIKVGKGGQGGIGDMINYFQFNYTAHSGLDGEESYFISNNVNLTAGGGYRGNITKVCDKNNINNCTYPNAGMVLNYKANGNIITKMNGISGATSPCTNTNCYFSSTNYNNIYCPNISPYNSMISYCNCQCKSYINSGGSSVCSLYDENDLVAAGSGGSAPYGGIGGITGTSGTCYGSTTASNGTTPGGGGSGSFVGTTGTDFSWAYQNPAGNGGNGTVQITFFIDDNTLSTLPTPTPSITQTTTISCSPIPSIAQSYTISCSKTISISPTISTNNKRSSTVIFDTIISQVNIFTGGIIFLIFIVALIIILLVFVIIIICYCYRKNEIRISVMDDNMFDL
jgi:hypothetical protein